MLWTSIGVLASLQTHYLYISLGEGDVGFLRVLISTLRTSYVWAILTPAIWWLTGRFAISRPREFIMAHLGGWLVCLVIQVLARASTGFLLPNPIENTGFFKLLISTFQLFFYTFLIGYILIAAGSLAIQSYRRLAEERERSAKLHADAMEARLRALQSQLQPHFLFNTLHAIASLVTESPPQAVEMIARLGELLRASLRNAEQTEVPLEDEFKFARQYLAIEQIRLGERLQVRWRIAPETRNLLVPQLLLQPLLENAIQHGIARSTEPGTLEIDSHLEEAGRLCLTVTNTGPGAPTVELRPIDPARGLNLSLGNIRARLDALYGPEGHTFDLNQFPNHGGACATVVVPAKLSGRNGSAEAALLSPLAVESTLSEDASAALAGPAAVSR